MKREMFHALAYEPERPALGWVAQSGAIGVSDSPEFSEAGEVGTGCVYGQAFACDQASAEQAALAEVPFQPAEGLDRGLLGRICGQQARLQTIGISAGDV